MTGRDGMDSIDTDPHPAVKSLRSKFEQLSSGSSSSANPQRNGGQGELLSPSVTSDPRPRASSGTFSPTLESNSHHLRSSSSSSDLKVGTKRPPPPPPPRSSKGTSPSPHPSPVPSPLLRPVPVPAAATFSSPRLAPSTIPRNGLSSSPNSDVSELSIVASLRNKFSASPSGSLRAQGHRPSNSIEYPPILLDITHSPTPIHPKPPIPPRPSRAMDSGILFEMSSSRDSEDYYPTPSHTPSDLLASPFLDDDEIIEAKFRPKHAASGPPILPSRKPQIQHTLGDHSAESSRTSSESDVGSESSSTQKMSKFPVVPPRPPPRPRTNVESLTINSAPIQVPPPLPSRRLTMAATADPPSTPTPPPLPDRPSVIPPTRLGVDENVAPSPTAERKVLGSARLPPPPTRTIALGDKLPPPRRPPSPSSDEESGDEEDLKVQAADLLPDSSRSSRRPPILSYREGHPEPKIQVQAFSAYASVAGSMVTVAHHHHAFIYDVSMSDVPIRTVDTKNMGPKDLKITCTEFKACAKAIDKGSILWLGTKDGHVIELDIRMGVIVGSKYSAHLHPISHIFRYGASMVTVDESGKTLIFSPDIEGEDVSLAYTQPRILRTSEKQDFVKLIGGKLWTAARGDQQTINGTLRTPILRVYDIFSPGNLVKSLVPTEHVGPATSATIIPSRPSHVYVGHEEGYISTWSLDTHDGFPECVEVMKVSTSDVLCLVGVNDKLWAGGRSGVISVYDVTQKPWIVTNAWNAHPGLPVMKLMVDPFGIDLTGKLCVYSIGRDEQLRLWDGLLGADWVDEELMKHENSFSQFRSLTVLVVSWNCDAARPDSLTGDPANVNFLTDVLHSVDSPDIVSFGFQEVIDLESRKMAAKNVLLGSKKKPEDGGLSDKVTGAYKRWYERLTSVMRTAMPSDTPYSVICTESLVGLFTCVFVKHSERMALKDIAITTIKRGMGGRYGNKGAIVARFVIEDSSICLINCHLAAGQNAVRQRNADVTSLVEEKAVFPEAEYPLAYVGGGDGSTVLDHEIVFVNGDMNYRIDYRRDAIINAIKSHDLASLLAYDQLLREIKFNRGFRFRGFSEGPLNFSPTYKYDPRSNQYDSSEKHRSPAWCDRVLWRARVPDRVQQLHYRRYETNVSDHRPISAAFTMTIKNVRHDVREKFRAEVRATWAEEQKRLLAAARQFYVSQALA